MPSFSLVIEYLTGYAVATDPSSRERPEWPPHPARVFMALAAAHFETDGSSEQKQAERAALEWLATLPPPDLVVPYHTARDVLAVYVPVNDQDGGTALLKRSRQPRTFPRVHVGDEPVRFIWRVDPAGYPQHMRSLESVCRHVTRIGHSSSLVWVRVEENGPDVPTHEVDPSGLGGRFRTPFGSMLRQLVDLYGEPAREAHAKLARQIESLQREIKQIKGNGAKKRKAPLQAKLKELEKEQGQEPRPPIRPTISHATSYREVKPKSPDVQQSVFDPNFIVLSAEDTTITPGLESTAQVVDALRKLIMSRSGIQPVPEWVSGHQPNGEKLQSRPHLAIVPLAFVGRPGVQQEQFADGHLMGLGILIPRDVPLAERGRVLAPLLFDADGQALPIPLTLGSLGAWPLFRESSATTTRQTLRTSTYTASSRTWASVTPVVLDRMPKADRVKDPLTWREEVGAIIATSCVNVGLPPPATIRVEKTPFFRGSPRAMPGQGGFPQLRKDKFQVHVVVEFDRPVAGPLLLGAGRFRGYGLLRPWREEPR